MENRGINSVGFVSGPLESDLLLEVLTLRVLARPVNIVAANDDHWDSEAVFVRHDIHLSSSFACRVRIRGCQQRTILFGHGAVGLTVDLIGVNVNKALDVAIVLDRIQEHMGAHNVVLGKSEGVFE